MPLALPETEKKWVEIYEKLSPGYTETGDDVIWGIFSVTVADKTVELGLRKDGTCVWRKPC